MFETIRPVCYGGTMLRGFIGGIRVIQVLVAAALLAACNADNVIEEKEATVKGLASRYGFPSLTQTGLTATLRSKYTTLSVTANSRQIRFNGLLVWLNGPVTKQDGTFTLTQVDCQKIIDALLRPGAALGGIQCRTVLLDPGHGGQDTGCSGPRNSHEKALVLDIALRVQKKLDGSGLHVALTRTDDRARALQARCADARSLKADILVSIHLNSASNPGARGLETYALPCAGYPSTSGTSNDTAYRVGNKFDHANSLLSYCLHKELIAMTNAPDRGVRKARFTVIADSPCPATLLECGFLSNPGEAEKLLTPAYRDRVATGIANGIRLYVAKVKTSAKR